MILIIDNYDSFTYNLYQYIGEMHSDILVKRNDEITIGEIKNLNPSCIIISPGPGFPKDAGLSCQIVKSFCGIIPILGVCLGHQVIGEAFGGSVSYAKGMLHGKATEIKIDTNSPIFSGLPDKITVGRYHSLIVEKNSLPSTLKIIATSTDDEIMAVSNDEQRVYGVQFHPESILTLYGKRIIKNFLCEVAKIKLNDEVGANIIISDKNVLKQYIAKVTNSKSLTEKEAESAMNCIMNGEATDAQIGSFLTALRMKGETIDEITGFAKTMRQKAAVVSHNKKVIDIVGTGGDLSNTFNISTTAAFVASGGGANVAKHGNRSVSSKSGSADVLEALSVKIDVSKEIAEKTLNEIGLCFMFAPLFHKSMKYAVTPRREIGIRSVFNILGPLSNPANADSILLGVYDKNLLEVMANVLIRLSVSNAIIVNSNDGLDEISICDKTDICEVSDKKIIKYSIDPKGYSMKIAKKEDILGGNSVLNAKITLDILNGQKGAKRDIVVLNSAFALYCAKVAKTVEEGIMLSKNSIDKGLALSKLNKLIELTNSN